MSTFIGAVRPAVCDCGHPPALTDGIGTGYGERHGQTYCYNCCARIDRQEMQRTGKATLYYDGTEVTNWPGTLRFHLTYASTGRHNIAGKQYHVWFNGPDGFVWHGVQYGEWTQVCHCRRTRRVARGAFGGKG